MSDYPLITRDELFNIAIKDYINSLDNNDFTAALKYTEDIAQLEQKLHTKKGALELRAFRFYLFDKVFTNTPHYSLNNIYHSKYLPVIDNIRAKIEKEMYNKQDSTTRFTLTLSTIKYSQQVANALLYENRQWFEELANLPKRKYKKEFARLFTTFLLLNYYLDESYSSIRPFFRTAVLLIHDDHTPLKVLCITPNSKDFAKTVIYMRMREAEHNDTLFVVDDRQEYINARLNYIHLEEYAYFNQIKDVLYDIINTAYKKVEMPKIDKELIRIFAAEFNECFFSYGKIKSLLSTDEIIKLLAYVRPEVIERLKNFEEAVYNTTYDANNMFEFYLTNMLLEQTIRNHIIQAI